MKRLRRYWRAYTRPARHRARARWPRYARRPDPWAEQILDHIWSGYIHDWAQRRRALYANTGSTI